MAERLCDSNETRTSETIPSNEEIVEEVMKGVEDCLIKSDDDKTGTNNDINCNASLNSSEQNPSEASNSACFEDPESVPITDNEDGKRDCDEDDFIDELGLKDLEDTYSDEEKEQHRLEAESHKTKGNDFFKGGDYNESIKSYTLGLRICPLAFPKERAILYSNRAAAKMKLDRKPSAIEDCTKALELDATYLKARFRRGQLFEETDKLDEALADYQEIIKLDPLHREALYATKRLPEKIHERNEKMKADMLAKLKDLGNMILRPFNLSTDNFQVNQDPNTGGYSINFKQNSQQ